jgi:hypothetical protein
VFYVFLWAATVPKNLLMFTLRGEKDLRKAFWNGVLDHDLQD